MAAVALEEVLLPLRSALATTTLEEAGEPVRIVLKDVGKAVTFSAKAGAAGKGAFSVSLDSSSSSSLPALQAGLTVATDSATFAKLVGGTLRPLAALGKVEVLSGSRDKARWLFRLFRRAKGESEWRPTRDEALDLDARVRRVCDAGVPGKLAYVVEVKATVPELKRSVEWTAKKRFSEFRALSLKISTTKSHEAPRFPSRSTASVSLRLDGLDRWLRFYAAAAAQKKGKTNTNNGQRDDDFDDDDLDQEEEEEEGVVVRREVYAFLEVDREICEAVATVRAARRAVNDGPLRVGGKGKGKGKGADTKTRSPPRHDDDDDVVVGKKKQGRLARWFLPLATSTIPSALLCAWSPRVVGPLALVGSSDAVLVLVALCVLTSRGGVAVALLALIARAFFWRVGVLRGLRIYLTASSVVGTYVVAKALATKVWKLDQGSPKREAFFDRIHRVVAPLVAVEMADLRSVWVKLGQYLASRADVVPETWKTSLAKLQDSLPADSPRAVERTLREEKASSSEKSSSSSEKSSLLRVVSYPALASASVAQVHAATTRGGEKVALKIQHRGVAELFKADVRRAIKIAKLCARLDSTFEPTVTVLESWQREIHKEVDFRFEVAHLKKARELLASYSEIVEVPEPREDVLAASERAFAMTFVEGAFRVDDRQKLDKFNVDANDLCLRFAHLLASLVLTSGFIHCDCHAGNVLVLPGSGSTGETGVFFKIAWLDWGWAHSLDEAALDAWRDLFLGLHDLDTTACVRALAALGYENNQDARAPERSVEFFTFLFRSTAGTAEARRETDAFFKARKDQQDNDKATHQRERGGRKMTKVPESFFFVVRVFGNLRGLCADLGVSIPLPDIMALHARAGKAIDLLHRKTKPDDDDDKDDDEGGRAKK